MVNVLGTSDANIMTEAESRNYLNIVQIVSIGYLACTKQLIPRPLIFNIESIVNIIKELAKLF